MAFVYHIIKQWGHGYINEDDKGLSERTQMTSNVETQVQANVDGVGLKEGIGLS
jgi:hypothetical protein